MAKPPRSPLLGYNHNIGHLGQVFHVQTEDSGPLTPRLFTHMFFEGTILASVKHEYDGQLTEDKVRVLMQNQHKAMIRDLLHARFDERLVTFFRARGVELAATAGALPSTPMLETPSPVLTAAAQIVDASAEALPAEAPPVDAPPAEIVEAAAPEPVQHITTASFVAEPASDEEREAELASSGSVPVPVAIPPAAERETRPFASRTRGAAGVAGAAGAAGKSVGGATARMSTTAPRRSPFVRNVEDGGAVDTKEAGPETFKAARKVAGKVARAAGADGVVVQRTVRVGGPPASSAASRPPRARRPAAFVLVGRDASPAHHDSEPEAQSSIADRTLRHAGIESQLPAIGAATVAVAVAADPLSSAAPSDPLHTGQPAPSPSRAALEASRAAVDD